MLGELCVGVAFQANKVIQDEIVRLDGIKMLTQLFLNSHKPSLKVGIVISYEE